jgi:hypothetical protein
MTQKVLYITESTFDFSQVDSGSTLVNGYKENLLPGVYHTSLGDLPVDQIIRLSSQFDIIKFEAQGFDVDSAIYKESRTLFQYLNKQYTDNQLDIQRFTTHPDIDTRLDQPMLWVFGCSHSHGTGLRSNELNYGQWLSQHLDLPLKLITKPGSSLAWSYRHLLNSCIQKHDTVVWQLTTPGRLSRFNGKHVDEIVLNSSSDRKLVDSITDEQLYFTQLSLLNTGTKFLQAIGCKFVITSISDFGANYDYVSEYIRYPEYCSNYGLHIDNGTDGVHPGPLSHKAIAQRILNHVQLRND